MEDEITEIVNNIRAIIVSTKGPTLLRNLSRDYDTICGGQIPFRKLNFNTLEDFLRSLPTLRVSGSGASAVVEAALSGESSHIASLVSAQKSSKKPAAVSRRGYPQTSYRGRGGGRGRGYFSKPYAPRDVQTKNFGARDYGDRDYGARDYNARDQPARDFRPPRDQPRDYSSGDQNHTNFVPKRYSPNLYKKQGSDQPGGPLTVKLDGDDKRQVSWKRNIEIPPRFQKANQQNLENQQITETQRNTETQQKPDIPSATSVTSESQVVEIQCLGSSLANNLVAYLQSGTRSSLLKITESFCFPGAQIENVELKLRQKTPSLNPKVPLAIMLGEYDVLTTTKKTKEIRNHYLSLVLYLRQLCPKIKLILIHLPICNCSCNNQSHLERVKSFNEFLSLGLYNRSNHIFVVSLQNVLDKFEFFNCEPKKVKPQMEVCIMNERGYSALVQYLIDRLQKDFETEISLEESKSTNIAYGPRSLIERARRKAGITKAEQNSSDFLLEHSSQAANNLAADFTRLSHQDSVSGAQGNQWLSSSGTNQILEDAQDDFLPVPDNDVIINNIDLLLRYCTSRGWSVPSYSVLPNPGQKGLYFASVKVHGDGANNFNVNSLPNEHENARIVKGYAAKKALERILAEETKKVKANKTISSDSHIICSRISDIVAGASSGQFAKAVEDEYISRYNELLPDDWLNTISSWPTLSVESTINSTIVLPREPPPLQAEPVQFNPSVPPPPLRIEALGDAEGMEDVYITHATSVNSVWFRVIGKDYSDEYELLLNNMDTYYKGVGAKDLALSLEVDQYYAAHDFENDTWFRVCVSEVDDASQMVVAWLIDLGDYERFPFGSLYRLAPQFCQLPCQAVLCALEGLESFIDDDIANEVVSNSELVIGKSLIAKITHKDTEAGFVKAVLYDTSGEDDVIVNEQIYDEIVKRAAPALPPENCPMEVAIGHVSKKGEVYIRFDSPSLDRITQICESLTPEKISENKLSSFKHISVNKLYLAKYSEDSCWYRAVVTTTPSVQHNQIPVRFIDYGNTESVSISDIVDLENLPPILRKLPAQAVKVALHNLPLETLTNPEVAKLHSLLMADEDKTVLIKTVSLKADPPIVEIFTRETENGALVSVNSTIELQRPRNEDKKAKVHQLISNNDDFVLQCPDLSDSEFQPVLVVLAAHPGNFIFQPVKYAKELKKLIKQMNAYYEAGAMPEIPVDRIAKNKLFAGRHHADEMWYRVLVTDSPMGTRVPVRLIDHGDVTCVNVSSLRELAPEFHVYPFMAVKGKLAGVVPRHKDWSVEDCIRFHSLVVDHLLAGIIVSIQSNNENPMEMVVTLNLVDTNSEQDMDIAEILLQEQRAVREG